MKNSIWISACCLLFSFSFAQAQDSSLSDSVYVLYQRFFELQNISDNLEKVETKVDSVTGSVTEDLTNLNKNYDYFNEVLKSNNEKISSISETQLFTNKTLVEKNIVRSQNATEFVEAALTALNALDLTNQIFTYTDQITALNNPQNRELGFSLNDRITKILEDEIFRGRSKINRVRRDKFLTIVDNILKSPITNSITDGLPVVGSIKSIVDMVVNVSLQGSDIDVKEVDELKSKLKSYVEYYQGLEDALRTFESKVGGIDVKTEALKLLLKNFVIERIKTLYPQISKNELEASLNTLLNKHYNYIQVQRDMQQMILNDHTRNGRINYTTAFSDQRVQFPDYAVGQARFITDEIEAITSEYEAALNIYQTSIQEVLNKSRVIGNDQKIDDKIQTLEAAKTDVIAAIKRNIDLPKIKKGYQSLQN